jgi:mRNA interferase RelE/StbE
LTISKKLKRPTYSLEFRPAALEEWKALDGSIKKPLKKLLAKRLEMPHVPGGRLTGDLLGCYKIKLRKQGIRLVYKVEDAKLVVIVLAVDRREDSQVYKSALARLVEKILEIVKT